MSVMECKENSLKLLNVSTGPHDTHHNIRLCFTIREEMMDPLLRRQDLL